MDATVTTVRKEPAKCRAYGENPGKVVLVIEVTQLAQTALVMTIAEARVLANDISTAAAESAQLAAEYAALVEPSEDDG